MKTLRLVALGILLASCLATGQITNSDSVARKARPECPQVGMTMEQLEEALKEAKPVFGSY
ncbi:MAG TPA: hypothetical protein VEC99_08495 [Clostridia bacterium]|nr:hypothetical protein [Clostridia bacterium]